MANFVYVANREINTVSLINAATNALTATISTENTISVIDGATNTIVATVPVGCFSYDIGVLP